VQGWKRPGPKLKPYRPPKPPKPPKPVSAFSTVDSAAKAIIDAGFKALAKVHHPDLGGNTATMSSLTETRRQLKQMLELIKE
jgi:hypothetical protein